MGQCFITRKGSGSGGGASGGGGSSNVLPLQEDGTYVEELYIPDGVQTIVPYFLYGNSTSQYVPYANIKKITMADSVTSIGEWSFVGAKNLTEVNFSANLVSIGNYAFQNTSLENVTLPDGFTTAGNACFSDCPIKTIYLPAGMAQTTSLTVTGGNYFLQYCTQIEAIILGNGWSNSLRCNTSDNLTHDSILNMFNALATVSGKTLTLGTANLAKMSDDEKAIATEKGWTLA